MGAELLVSTNKAHIWLRPDGTVFKEYFDGTRARDEYESLQRLHSIMPSDLVRDDWTYRVVACHGYDEASQGIHLDLVGGATLAEVLGKDPGRARLMGEWLGLFHANAPAAGDLIALYSDVSVYNFMLDDSNRTVTAIDPGREFGRMGPREVDVLMGVASLASLAARQRRWPDACVTAFLSGYGTTLGEPAFRPPMYDEAVRQVIVHYVRKAPAGGKAPGARHRLRLLLLRQYLGRRVPSLAQSQASR